MRKLILLVGILILILVGWSLVARFIPGASNFLENAPSSIGGNKNIEVVSEESVVIDIVEKVTPSVVTVAEQIPENNSPFFDPFFGLPEDEEGDSSEPQNIGSGFVVTSDGLIVTNKHVVSDIDGVYFVITNTDKRYQVKQIYRDPLNDIAIIKIDSSEHNEKLIPVEMGDSSKLQVGQLVVAIGTPLGRFTNSVTSGIVSGLGRGITAGSPFQGFAEELDNVIQTDAAISPGNSGGPLLNSSSQVIGVNTAIASAGENIGFALPINLIKDSIRNFNETGQFNRPFLGISYRIVDEDTSGNSNLPEGAYIQRVVANSPAEKAGIEVGDIITEIDGERIVDNAGAVAGLIAEKKVGDSVLLTVFRDGNTREISATLERVPQN